MFVSVAWHVPSDLYRLIVSAAGNIPPKNASDIFPSRGISEARLPKLVGVIDFGSQAAKIGRGDRFRRRKQCFQQSVGVHPSTY